MDTLSARPEQVLSIEQQADFVVNTATLSLIMSVAVFLAIGISFTVFLVMAAREQARTWREERAAKRRHLRYVSSGEEAVLKPPVIPPRAPTDMTPTHTMGTVPASFHIFLSHVWGTGQDQMRIVKVRLLEMLPDVLVFLGARSSEQNMCGSEIYVEITCGSDHATRAESSSNAIILMPCFAPVALVLTKSLRCARESRGALRTLEQTWTI